MAASAEVLLERYLHTSYRPDREFIDDRIVERNVGEFPHGRMMAVVGARLLEFEKQCGMVGLMSCRTQVSATRIRVPDLIFLPPCRPLTGIVRKPPFLCVEILSPLDRYIETHQRIGDYLEFGVQYVWVIDPATMLATIYTQDGAREIRDGILTTQNPDITIDLNELDPD